MNFAWTLAFPPQVLYLQVIWAIGASMLALSALVRLPLIALAGIAGVILVGHNAHFDLGFINAAVARSSYKRCPFHPFSVFDTATLGGVALGQTVLARALQATGLGHDAAAAHSAIYDAEKTADLFCLLVNRLRPLYAELGNGAAEAVNGNDAAAAPVSGD